jgi:Mg-chelatase subunit ChlD
MKKYKSKISYVLVLLFLLTQVISNSIIVKASIVSDKLTFTRTITNSKGEVGTSIAAMNAKAGEVLTLNYSMGSGDVTDTLNTTSKKKKVVLVIDTSGSMDENDIGGQKRLTVAKAAAVNFINKVASTNVDIAIVGYDNYVYQVQSFLNSSTYKQTLINAINSNNLYADGGTNIGDGLRKAYYMLKDLSDTDYSKYMVLLTDGEPTAWSYTSNYSNYYTGSGSYDRWYSDYSYAYDENGTRPLEYANKIGDMLSTTKINSYMIGFTTSANKNKLSTIAQHAKATVSTATDSNGLNSVYNSIADQIINDITVKDITFQESFANNIDVISMPEGFTKTTNASTGITTVSGTLANLSFYKVNGVFKLVAPVTFNIGIKFKDGTNGSSTLLASNSQVTFTDYNNTPGSKNFNSLTVNVTPAITKISNIPVDYTRSMTKNQYYLVNNTTEDIVVSNKVKPNKIDYYSLLSENYSKEKYVVVVADTSGSMAWDINGNQYTNNISRMNSLKNTLTSSAGTGFLDKLANAKNVNIGLVGYSTKAVLGNNVNSTTSDNIIENGQLQDFADMTNASEVTALKAQVSNLYANGATNIGDGLRRAYWLLSKVSSNAEKYIILMTDGEPTKYTVYSYNNDYYYGEDTATDSMLKGAGDSDYYNYALNYANGMASIIGQNKINSYIIGFSNGINASKLTQIAKSADGTYNEAKSSSDLQQIYDKLAGEITKDIPIKNLTYETVIPEGLTVKAIAKDGVQYTNFTTTALASGETKVSFDLESIAKIDYRLNEQSYCFEAPEINFDLVLTANKTGNYTLQQNSASNYTKVTYTDLPTATQTAPVTNLFSSNAVSFTVVDGNSIIYTHGLFLNKTNDVSENNFQVSDVSNIKARNSNTYTAGVVLAINKANSYLKIDIPVRDTSKITNTNDINVVVKKVSSDDSIGEIVTSSSIANPTITKNLNSNGTTTINIPFSNTGKYLVTYTFQMEAVSSNYTEFKSTATSGVTGITTGTSTKDLKFEIKSEIIKHGLYINNTNDVSDSNFTFSTSNTNLAAQNGNSYTAGVVLDLSRSDSILNINIAAREVSKLQSTSDINVVIKKVNNDDRIAEEVSNLNVVKNLNSDGTSTIRIPFPSTGKYLVTYTFNMQATSANYNGFTNTAVVLSNNVAESNSKELKFDIRSQIVKHGLFINNDANDLSVSNFISSTNADIAVDNSKTYTAGVIVDLTKTTEALNIDIDTRDLSKISDSSDIVVTAKKVSSDNILGEAYTNIHVNPTFDKATGTANINISFEDIGRFLVTYTFKMEAKDDKVNGFTNVATVDADSKALKFDIKSDIVKHGLFINGDSTDLSDSNFVINNPGSLSVANGNVYTAGVLLDLNRNSSPLNINIAPRDVSKLNGTTDISVSIKKVLEDGTLEDVSSGVVISPLNSDGKVNIKIDFSDKGNYLIAYTFKMEATSNNFDGFTNTASVETSSKTLKFDMGSKIEKHALFINANNDLSDNNFKTSNPNNLTVFNNRTYTDGIILDLKRTSSVLTIDLAARDASKVQNKDDIRIFINKINDDGSIGEAVAVTPTAVNTVFNGDGTTKIQISFDTVGKYLVRYTFLMQATSNFDNFIAKASIEASSENLQFSIGSEVDKHGIFLGKTNTVADDNFKLSTTSNVGVANDISYTAGVVLDVMRTSSQLNIDIAKRDTSKLQGISDIAVVVRKVNGDGTIGAVASNATAIPTPNADGTTNIKVTFGETGKYLVNYTFEMQVTQGSTGEVVQFVNTAEIEDSKKDLKLDVKSELPDLF